MYKLFCLSAAFIFLFSIPAYAAEIGGDVIDDPLFVDELLPDQEDDAEDEDTAYMPLFLTSVPDNSNYGSDVSSTLPSGVVESSEPEEGTMKAVLQSIFGVYEPVQQSITVTLSDGTTADCQEVVTGISGVDWAYISGVALFGLSLAAFFKTLRVVINSGRC